MPSAAYELSSRIKSVTIMYAVIETGGKQYKVGLGDRLKVEKLAVKEGESVDINRVLMVAEGDQVAFGKNASGQPVKAEVLGHGRGKKIKVFKKKRRKGYRRTQGHRQDYTEIRIVGIGDQVFEAVEAAPETIEEMEPIESSEQDSVENREIKDDRERKDITEKEEDGAKAE